jgi:Predicted metal-dependent hydrolase
MTDLVVRKMAFQFDATVPFMWQPANPHFAIFCNAFTFIAVPFEKYIIPALRRAQDRLNSGAGVAEEAEAFLRQEAQHAAAHRKHMLALIKQYPGLEQCYERTVASFNDLIDAHPVEFHAAYIANLEATFTPMFKVILDHRDSLFAGGDKRVASLMMWHFVEEIEHRSSRLMLYRHLMPDPWYRVKRVRETLSRRRHRGNRCQGLRRTHSVRRPWRVCRAGDVLGGAQRVRLSCAQTVRRPAAGVPRGPHHKAAQDVVGACAVADTPSRSGRSAVAGLGRHLDA